MAWKPFNPNPLGLKVGDCTVRAICAVTGLSWDQAHRRQCELAREMADMPSADRVWWELLRKYGFTRQSIIDRCPDCYTVADFARDHPYGDYVLGPKEHAVAVKSGDWLDTWDSGATVPSYYFSRR